MRPTLTMRTLLLAVLVVSAASALAQETPKDPKRAEQLIDLGFRYRRDGELSAARAAYDEAARTAPEKSDDRKKVALDAYDVAWVESKFAEAARLVQGVDVLRQVRALVKAGNGKAALEVAQKAKDSLAEGLALRGLGRNDDALAALAKAGAAGLAERADLLASLGRLADAAKDYEAAGQLYNRARALERAGTAVDWKPVAEEVKKRLEVLLAKGTEGKRSLEVAQGLAAKERARLALADLHDQISREYEHYSVVHEKTNDKAKALKLLELAIQFSEEGRKTLTDSNRDKYGEARVKQLGLLGREEDLQQRARALRR